MISSAVLLRSGYDFFRDISISAVTARESYRYYKSMREIIRSENGGDMTYFLEYYLELLVRALDMRNERLRKREQEAREREQEALRQEREMARQPMTQTVRPCEENVKDRDAQDDTDGTQFPEPPAPAEEEQADAENVSASNSASPFVSAQSRMQPPVPLMEPQVFLQAISKLRHSRYRIIREMPDKVGKMIEAGITDFSVSQWAEFHEMDYKYADYECRYMFEKGWMTREKTDRHYVYSLRISLPQRQSDDSSSAINITQEISSMEITNRHIPAEAGLPGAQGNEGESPPEDDPLQCAVRRMGSSRSAHVRLMGATIRKMLTDGTTGFTCQEWKEISGMNAIEARDACDYLLSHRLVRNISDRKNRAVYVFQSSQSVREKHAENGPADGGASEEDADGEEIMDREMNTARPSESLIAQLKEMLSGEMGERNRRISCILLSMIEKGVYSFRAQEVAMSYNMPKSTCISTLRTAANLGFIRKEPCSDETGCFQYVINRERKTGIRSDGLTKTQRGILTALYNTFTTGEFSIREGAAVTSQLEGTLAFHLHNFVQCGILKAREGKGNTGYYTFTVTPSNHPLCFIRESMEITYHRKGDYLYPNLVLEMDEPLTIGKYGLLRKSYLKEHKPHWYQSMLMTGKLERHLAEIDRTAQERVERIVEQLAKSFPPPDKADDPLGWAAHMNGLVAMAEETVLRELVYA